MELCSSSSKYNPFIFYRASKVKPGASLIEDLDEITSISTTSGSSSTKTKVPVIKKGFLNSGKETNIYPDGGSSEGGKPGTCGKGGGLYIMQDKVAIGVLDLT